MQSYRYSINVFIRFLQKKNLLVGLKLRNFLAFWFRTYLKPKWFEEFVNYKLKNDKIKLQSIKNYINALCFFWSLKHKNTKLSELWNYQKWYKAHTKLYDTPVRGAEPIPLKHLRVLLKLLPKFALISEETNMFYLMFCFMLVSIIFVPES